MTAKEKALELSWKYEDYGQTDNSIQCAIIAVEDTINVLQRTYCLYKSPYVGSELDYYIEVKQELEKMS